MSSLTAKTLREASKQVTDLTTRAKEAGLVPKQPKTSHYSYFTEDCARIGKYAAEHGPAKAVHHFLSLLKHPVLESTTCFLKKLYFTELRNKDKDREVSGVSSLPTKVCGCPLLLGCSLDEQVEEYMYVTAL